MHRLLFVCVLVGYCNAVLAGLSNMISVSITSRWNQTGHKIIQFDIVRNSDADVWKKMVPWHLNVVHGDKKSAGYDSEHLTATVTVRRIPATSDYKLIPLIGYYKLHTKATTWSEAFDICEREGGHLAILNSDEEAQALVEMLKGSPKPVGAAYDSRMLLGFNDMVTEGKFVTIFGDDIAKAGYAKWIKNEPNNLGSSDSHPGQDCGSFSKSTGLLDDVTCIDKYAFICEQELQ